MFEKWIWKQNGFRHLKCIWKFIKAFENLKVVVYVFNERNLERKVVNNVYVVSTSVTYLEAGQKELSKLPSSQELFTYLSCMNNLTQNSMAKEAVVKNLTLQLHSQSTESGNLRQQLEKCTSNIQHLNGSLINVIRDVHDQIEVSLLKLKQ